MGKGWGKKYGNSSWDSNHTTTDVEGVTDKIAKAVDDSNPYLPFIVGAAVMATKSFAKNCGENLTDIVEEFWGGDQ